MKLFLKVAELRYDSVRNTLAKLKLLSGGELLNAAVMFFAKRPQQFSRMPGCGALRLRGTILR